MGLGLLVAGAVGAESGSGSPAGVTAASLQDERRAIEERYAVEAAQCRARLAVNPCLEQATSRRRAALEAVREREQQLDEARRRERAEARRRSVEQRQAQRGPSADVAVPAASAGSSARAAFDGPQAGLAASGGGTLPAREPVDTAGAASAPVAEDRDAAPPRRAATGDPDAAAAQRAQRSAQRQLEQQRRRQRIDERVKEREARGRLEAPLPLPPGVR